MSRYMRSSDRSRDKEARATPPVWRGIGCLLAILVPLLSWILAFYTVQWALITGRPLPQQLIGYVVTPAWLWGVPGFPPVLALIERQPHLLMTILVTLLYVVALSALLSFAYSLVYRFVGPSQLGPYDAPPPEIKVGRYKR